MTFYTNKNNLARTYQYLKSVNVNNLQHKQIFSEQNERLNDWLGIKSFFVVTYGNVNLIPIQSRIKIHTQYSYK